MASPQESNIISVYFKIPYTEITTLLRIPNNLTIRQFLEYVDNDLPRINLNIHQRYSIQVVETGKPGGELAVEMEPRDDQTLLQRYGNNNSIAFYVRPVEPSTRQFIRSDIYSN